MGKFSRDQYGWMKIGDVKKATEKMIKENKDLKFNKALDKVFVNREMQFKARDLYRKGFTLGQIKQKLPVGDEQILRWLYQGKLN